MAADRTPASWLVEDAAGFAYELTAPVTTLGRDPRNAILIHDATVSRFHAEVRREGAAWVLHVNGTTGAEVNGTRVDGSRTLADGDRLGIGTRSYRLHRGELPGGVVPYIGHDPGLSNDPLLQHTTTTMPAVPRVPPRRFPRWVVPALLGVIAAALFFTCAGLE